MNDIPKSATGANIDGPKRPNINLGKTQITDKIRVSSAAIYYDEWFGERYQCETWIFSDDKEKQKSHQIIHFSCHPDYVYQNTDKVRKIHKQISDNLLKKYRPSTSELLEAIKIITDEFKEPK